MKKLFFVVLAAAAMVACTNDEVVSIKGGDAIAFDNVILDNATRAAADPSITTATIDGFNVWAYMDEVKGTVFNAEDVTKGADGWGYVNTQYWMPSHTYYFAALAPMDSENWTLTPETDDTKAIYGAGSVAFTNVDGSEDLLYAVDKVTTPEDINAQPEPVKFTFKHLLSKVKFTFVNGFGTENASIKVTNIKMVAPAKATIDLAQENYAKAWTIDETQNVELAFGDLATTLAMGKADECADERLTIPAAATEEYKVTFTATLYIGEIEAFTADLESTVTGVELEMGKAYNFKATLNAANISEDGNSLYPIEFEVVAVEDWVNGGEPEFDVDTTDPIVVTDGQTYDGQGSTISAAEDRADSANGIITPASGDVTIKNVNIDGNNRTTEGGKGLRGIYLNGVEGTYTIENVKIEGTAYAINVNSTKNVNLNVYNSTLQGWTSYGDTTTGYFENVNFTVGSYYTPGNSYSSNDNGLLRPYGNTTLVNCNFQDGFYICLSEMAGNTLVLNNCTYGGETITAENYKTLVKWDNYTDACNIVILPTVVKTAAELQAALDAGTEVIAFGADITGDVTATQTPGVYVVIDGKNYKYDGTIYVSGQSSTNHDKGLTIKKVNFETTATERDFINSSTDALRYACNIAIEDCTFTGASNEGSVVAIRLRQTYGLTVKNCTATNVHSLAQITSSQDMAFNNVIVTAGRGVNLQTAAHGEVVFDGCTFNAVKGDGYGIRVEAVADKKLTVNNSTITAFNPIYLRGTAASFVLNVNNTTLNVNEGGEDIVVEGETPTININ